MDWVRDFYAKQYEWADWRRRWSGFDPNERNARVDAVTRHAGPAPCRILELGSGTGTTAAALGVLMGEDRLKKLLADAVEAARARSVELGK